MADSVQKPAYIKSSSELKALCILEACDRTDTILAFLKERHVRYDQTLETPGLGSRLSEEAWDLILVDVDMEGFDVVLFLNHCRKVYATVPVIAFYNGARGTRDTALIRMGAFDALPKDIDRWNAEVYLDRAISQALQARKLLSLSRTDHVTGLYNQRFLYESLEKEIQRSIRTSRDLTVALLDLDNFKAYNDTYGHLKGDDALAEIAAVIKTSIRKGTDSAFRYGGDEFMLVLPETDLKQAAQTLSRILNNLENQISIPLTFSVGLALMGKSNSAQDIIRCADEAMYRAKKSGGNSMVQIVCGK